MDMRKAPAGTFLISIIPSPVAGFRAATLAWFCSAVDTHPIGEPMGCAIEIRSGRLQIHRR